jgi:hypothetical protein
MRGDAHIFAKLTSADATEIRSLKGKTPQSALAKRFGVSPSCIQSIHDGKTWKHIKETNTCG